MTAPVAQTKRRRQRQAVNAAALAHLFGRLTELLAKRPGECLMRAITEIERYREDVRRSGGEAACCLAEAPRLEVLHHRPAGRSGERICKVRSGNTAGSCDAVQAKRLFRIALHHPERLIRDAQWNLSRVVRREDSQPCEASFDQKSGTEAVLPCLRRELQQPTLAPGPPVFQQPDRTVRPLLHFADPPPHIESLRLARAVAVELDAHQ